MNSRRGLMSISLEDNEVTGLNLDEAVANLETSGSEIDRTSDQLEEGVGISQTVNSFAQTTEDAIENNNGLSEETASTIETALEHFTKRLGYTKTVVPGLESFRDKSTRLKQSKVTLENLKTLNTELDKTLVVSQEGFIDTVGKHFVDLFNTDKGLKEAVRKAADIANNNGLKVGEIKGSFALRRSFSVGGKEEVNGADAIKIVTEALAFKKELESSLDTLGKISRELNANVKESTFVAKDSFVKEIEKLKRQTYTISNRVNAIKAQLDKNGQGDAVYTALTKSEVNKIAALTEELVTNNENEFGQIFSGHSGKIRDLSIHHVVKGGIRLMFERYLRILGVWASDTRKVRWARFEITSAIHSISAAYKYLTMIAHSTVKYIEASTSKQ